MRVHDRKCLLRPGVFGGINDKKPATFFCERQDSAIFATSCPICTGLPACSLLFSHYRMTSSLLYRVISVSLKRPSSNACRAFSVFFSLTKAITTCPVGLKTPKDVGNFARMGLAIFISFPRARKFKCPRVSAPSLRFGPKRNERGRIRSASICFIAYRHHHDDGSRCLYRS